MTHQKVLWLCIFAILALCIATFLIYISVSPSSNSTNTDAQTESAVSNTLKTFTTYNDQYLIGTKSNGNVITTIKQSMTGLDCSNRIPLEKNCVGANWYASTFVCELVSELLPLCDNATSTLIIADSTNLSNNVANWTSVDDMKNDGNLYCSLVLANSTLARALCANIPECGAFTFEYDSNNIPQGCLKVNAPLYPSATVPTKSPNVVTYTGTRTDGVVFNQSGDLTNVVYRWNSSPLGTITQSMKTTNFAECSAMLNTVEANDATSSYVASWEATTGQCNLYNDITGITQSSTMTTILSNIYPAYLRYSNSWTPVYGIDYPNANAGLAVNYQTILQMCINSSYDAFVWINGRYYLRNTSDPQVSVGGAIAYVIPTTFL